MVPSSRCLCFFLIGTLTGCDTSLGAWRLDQTIVAGEGGVQMVESANELVIDGTGVTWGPSGCGASGVANFSERLAVLDGVALAVSLAVEDAELTLFSCEPPDADPVTIATIPFSRAVTLGQSEDHAKSFMAPESGLGFAGAGAERWVLFWNDPLKDTLDLRLFHSADWGASWGEEALSAVVPRASYPLNLVVAGDGHPMLSAGGSLWDLQGSSASPSGELPTGRTALVLGGDGALWIAGWKEVVRFTQNPLTGGYSESCGVTFSGPCERFSDDCEQIGLVPTAAGVDAWLWSGDGRLLREALGPDCAATETSFTSALADGSFGLSGNPLWLQVGESFSLNATFLNCEGAFAPPGAEHFEECGIIAAP